MTGLSIVLKLREMTGRFARMALCGLGLVLTAQQTQAACTGNLKDYSAGLEIDERAAPRSHRNPYRLAPYSEPTSYLRGDCGTWVARNFVLWTKLDFAHFTS
jgi:hypothetical protein